MKNRIVLCTLACFIASAACGSGDQRHPALKVANTPSGLYDIAFAVVSTTCSNPAVITDRTPPASLEVTPRPDLAAGTYYFRFEGWNYLGAANLPEIVLANGHFEGSTISPLILVVNRVVTAVVAGRQSGNRLDIRYVDEIAASEQGPGCQVQWLITAVRRPGIVYEAVLLPLKQDCASEPPAALGALLQIQTSSKPNSATFRFEYGGRSGDVFESVQIEPAGRFAYHQATSEWRTATLEGMLALQWLSADYLEEFQSSAGECSMAWQLQARQIL